MVTMEHPPTTGDEVLEAVVEVVPVVVAQAADVEAARRLSAELLQDLVATGCFRMLLPRSHGGIGVTLPVAMRVVETFSRADASVGWIVMIGSGAWIDLAGLPRPTFDRLYADSPDVMIAGAISPSGVAVTVDDGYRVSGRWAFASGCPHADWLYGNCVEQSGDAQRLRIALFARDEVEIEDTWHVLGLRGTGSHHFRVENVTIPANRTWAIIEDEPTIEDIIVRVPAPAILALQIGAVAIGTARGALDEITKIATTKMPLLSRTSLSGSPTFHTQLATADTTLRAAHALLYASAEEAWATASAGSRLTVEQRARIRAAATWTVSSATDVVTTAYRAGGGSAVYLDSPLQRRLRDIYAVTQHFLVRADTLATAGAVMAGQELDVPLF